uniref:Uncharacterized protein n=1 Tax=Anguilla anguilla TaxID=7936 RepID=A0A0E9U3B2_ANGAN
MPLFHPLYQSASGKGGFCQCKRYWCFSILESSNT